MSFDSWVSEAGAASAEQASVPAQLDAQRRELQGRIEALRRAGALPSVPQAAPPDTIVQWSNWSNG